MNLIFPIDETSQVVQKAENDVRIYSKSYVQTYSKIYYYNIIFIKGIFTYLKCIYIFRLAWEFSFA